MRLKVSEFGNGGHIVLPRGWIGKDVLVKLLVVCFTFCLVIGGPAMASLKIATTATAQTQQQQPPGFQPNGGSSSGGGGNGQLPQTFIGFVTKIIDGNTIELNGMPINLAMLASQQAMDGGNSKAVELMKSQCRIGSTVVFNVDNKATPTDDGDIHALVECDNGNININHAILAFNFVKLDQEQCSTSEFANQPWAAERCNTTTGTGADENITAMTSNQIKQKLQQDLQQRSNSNNNNNSGGGGSATFQPQAEPQISTQDFRPVSFNTLYKPVQFTTNSKTTTLSNNKLLQILDVRKPIKDTGNFTGVVTRIVDGDTLYLGKIPIRLSLVNTPERGQPGYEKAKMFTAGLCDVGEKATFNVDDRQSKSFNRTVGVVYCPEKLGKLFNLNEQLLLKKDAVVLTKFCPISEFSQQAWVKKYCNPTLLNINNINLLSNFRIIQLFILIEQLVNQFPNDPFILALFHQITFVMNNPAPTDNDINIIQNTVTKVIHDKHIEKKIIIINNTKPEPGLNDTKGIPLPPKGNGTGTTGGTGGTNTNDTTPIPPGGNNNNNNNNNNTNPGTGGGTTGTGTNDTSTTGGTGSGSSSGSNNTGTDVTSGTSGSGGTTGTGTGGTNDTSTTQGKFTFLPRSVPSPEGEKPGDFAVNNQTTGGLNSNINPELNLDQQGTIKPLPEVQPPPVCPDTYTIVDGKCEPPKTLPPTPPQPPIVVPPPTVEEDSNNDDDGSSSDDKSGDDSSSSSKSGSNDDKGEDDKLPPVPDETIFDSAPATDGGSDSGDDDKGSSDSNDDSGHSDDSGSDDSSSKDDDSSSSSSKSGSNDDKGEDDEEE